MAGILRQNIFLPHGRSGIYPTRIWRDLGQIADLVKLCFEGRLDDEGRAAIREMKAIASLGIFLMPFGWLNKTGPRVELGYVWREHGKVVGNVSMYRGGRTPDMGRGWLIANVATHPDYRRQGIARKLVSVAVKDIQARGGPWVMLLVETANIGAIELYKELGFKPFETVEHWQAGSIRLPAEASQPQGWLVRQRRRDETGKEIDLVMNRARSGAMFWTRPVEQSDFLLSGTALADGRLKEHWILEKEGNIRKIYGALWVETSGWSKARLALFMDPALQSVEVESALLSMAFHRSALLKRSVRIEIESHAQVEGTLRELGFRRLKTLVQMRREF